MVQDFSECEILEFQGRVPSLFLRSWFLRFKIVSHAWYAYAASAPQGSFASRLMAAFKSHRLLVVVSFLLKTGGCFCVEHGSLLAFAATYARKWQHSLRQHYLWGCVYTSTLLVWIWHVCNSFLFSYFHIYILLWVTPQPKFLQKHTCWFSVACRLEIRACLLRLAPVS